MDKGYPWDNYQGDVREYGAQDMANAFGKIMKNGVVNRLTDFLVSPQAGNVVRVGAGQAWINGHTVSVLGFEDIEIPFGGEATGAKTYGRLVLQAREETAYRDFQIVYKPPVNDASPEVADNEISLAYVASKRTAVTVSTDDIIRDVTAAACVNSDIVSGDYTDISGMLKGEYGKISRAVPGTDYVIPVNFNTWVPTPAGNDFSISNASIFPLAANYAKLDKLIFIHFRGRLEVSSDTGMIAIKGLPFAPSKNYGKLYLGETKYLSTYPIIETFPYHYTHPDIFTTQKTDYLQYNNSIAMYYQPDTGGNIQVSGNLFFGGSIQSGTIDWEFTMFYLTDE